jgi:hypothetical protein
MKLAVLALCLSPVAARQFPVEWKRPFTGHVLIEEAGERRPATSGSFEVWARSNGPLPAKIVTLDDQGAFSSMLPNPMGWMDIGVMTLEGRRAWTRFSDRGLKDDNAPVTIVARFEKPCRLHVVDARTGLDLDQVELLRTWAPGNEPPGNPSNASSWPRLGTRSPMSIPVFHTNDATDRAGYVGICAYWARAPGHAWNRIEIDPANGGDWTLPLFAAMVRIDEMFTHRFPFECAWFAKRTDDESAPIPLPSDGFSVLTPLEPGDWDLQIGEVGRDHRMVGPAWSHKPFHLDVGEILDLHERGVKAIVEAAVAARHACTPVRVRLEGKLRIPAEWDSGVDRFVFQRRGESSDAVPSRLTLMRSELRGDAAGPDGAVFDLGDVEAGNWTVSLARPAWIRSFALVPATTERLSIALAAPQKVEFHVIDGIEKTPVDCLVSLQSADEASVYASNAFLPATPVAPGVFERNVPLGPLTLNIERNGQSDRKQVIVEPGNGQVTVEVFDSIAVRVDAFDGDARLTSDRLWATAETIDGKRSARGIGQSWGVEDEGVTVFLDGPGAWRIRLLPPAEYVAPDPFEIDVALGSHPRVIFHLQRAPR